MWELDGEALVTYNVYRVINLATGWSETFDCHEQGDPLSEQAGFGVPFEASISSPLPETSLQDRLAASYCVE